MVNAVALPRLKDLLKHAKLPLNLGNMAETSETVTPKNPTQLAATRARNSTILAIFKVKTPNRSGQGYLTKNGIHHEGAREVRRHFFKNQPSS